MNANTPPHLNVHESGYVADIILNILRHEIGGKST